MATGTLNTVADDAQRRLEAFSALTPNERVEIARAGVIRDWDDLDPAEQAHIEAKTAELRQRLADA